MQKKITIMWLLQLKNFNTKFAVFLMFFLGIQTNLSFSQNKKIYEYNLNSNKNYGYNKIKSISKSNNAYNFMALGYFINANNNMYLKTKDKSYLETNLEIIKPILLNNDQNNYIKGNWKMNVAKTNQNAVVNGQEHLISEGYFFRYVGEFLDIISKNKLYKEHQSKICGGLIHSFSKWKERSFEKYGDYSSLFHQRLHTGANWGIVAMYLNIYDTNNSKDYSTFINQFDEQLKKALVLKTEGGKKYYTWNSTYPEKFCKALKTLKNYKPVIQDVSHGNHVVLYLLKAKELNNSNWNNFNFTYLSNTLKMKILKTYSIADNVDGTSTNDVKNTGWKISDGWYKLIYIDQTLDPLFQSSLNIYNNKIQGSFLEAQFNSIYL